LGNAIAPSHEKLFEKIDLSGKTVVPFNTNGGYGIGSTFETVKELCPNSKVTEGFSIKGGVERDGILFVMEGEKEKQARLEVQKWLQTIKVVK
jgi:hypothetical protein